MGTMLRWTLAALLATSLLAAGCGDDGGDGSGTLSDVKSRKVVKAGIRTDNPPHSIVDEKGELQGFDVDIARAVARELGVRLEIVKVDELTRISFLENRKIDMAVASMSHTLKREDEVDFSQTYFFSKQTFLVRSDSGIDSLRELAGKRVGASRGSSSLGNWRTWLEDHGLPSDPTIVEFDDKQAGVKAVQQGRIEGYTEDAEVLVSFAKQNDGLKVLTGEGTGLKLDGIGVRENDSDWRDAINVALQAIESSGEYDRIYDRWFGPNSEVPLRREGSIEVWPEG